MAATESASVLDLTVVILTYNESDHIERSIASVREIAKRVVVVDSFSSDDTVRLGRQAGAEVLQRKFINQAEQMNWALDNLDIQTEWVMRLDADETIGADLRQALRAQLHGLPKRTVGIVLQRRHVFMGRWIKHGGRYPVSLIRLWRNGCARVEDRWMDEHILVHGGGVTTIEGEFSDINLRDLSYFTDKHNKYATREAVEVLNRRYDLFGRLTDEGSIALRAKIVRLCKVLVYERLPFELAATFYFLWRYVVRLGFLDGRPGFIYHYLQGYWYRVLVGSKVWELDAVVRDIPGRAERIAELRRRTGLDL